MNEINSIYTSYCPSSFGIWQIDASDKGLRKIHLLAETEIPQSNAQSNEFSQEAVKQLGEYFEKQRQTFDLPLDWTNASAFYQQVWAALLQIPYGTTTSYTDIAKKINHQKAVRAVGLANGRNPLPLVVPCHRVIGKDGKLTGFAYGLDVKQKLLALENIQTASKQYVMF